MAEQLSTGVHWLTLGWPAPLGGNAFLVDDGDLTLIDAGLPFNLNGLRDEIMASGYQIRDIDRVLITHYDLDHIGGLARLVPDLDAPVYIGAIDYELLMGEWNPPLCHHKGMFHRGLRFVYRVPAELSYKPVVDNERIGDFVAVHTPGHNPGHLVYHHEALDVVFFGDLVWESDGELTIPIWLDSYNISELKSSVKRVAEQLHSFEMACMAHGTPIREDGAQFLQLLARDLAS